MTQTSLLLDVPLSGQIPCAEALVNDANIQKTHNANRRLTTAGLRIIPDGMQVWLPSRAELGIVEKLGRVYTLDANCQAN
jgi:hypothetical protein